MWSRVQDIPTNTFNLVTGNAPLEEEVKKPTGKFLKARGKPDQEITRSHRETSSTRTQVYGSGESDSDEDYEDEVHEPPRKKKRVKKDDEDKGMLKSILNVVNGLVSTPAPTPTPTPTPPSYPPPQQPLYSPSSFLNQKPQQQGAVPQPFRTKSGSLNCSFCRQAFGFVVTPSDHYITCALALSNERRCAHFREGCPEKFPVPPGPRDDKKANIGKPYADHLAVCKFHRCRSCTRNNQPSQHSNLRCPEMMCGLCKKKGHAEYLCHEC